MIETKYTPGPWEVNPSSAGTPFWVALNQNGNIAAMQIIGEANARLIAVAPELLEASNAAVAHCEQCADVRAMPFKCARCQTFIRLIAKAKGGAK